MYYFIRNILFLFDAEKVHKFSMHSLQTICSIAFARKILANCFAPKVQNTVLFNGLHFRNRIGLAAGFDKNARYLRELQALGFGHVEVGTVTPKPQPGNDKPRLFRLIPDKAIINRMGFNNEGVEAMVKRLADWKEKHPKNNQLIIGGNIGKNKITPNEDAWKDYETCFLALFDYVDYFVVNVSSPNTPGLRELQEKSSLQKIFAVLQSHNQKKPQPKPLLLKIAPDLTTEQTDDVISLAIEMKLDGLVISNTTISREGLSTASRQKAEAIGAGGLSGAPLKEKSTHLLRYIYFKTNGAIPLIASGGVFNAIDAKEKLAAGASLVQVYTGFIYEGPGIVSKIENELNG